MRETFFRPRLTILEVTDRVPGGLGDIPRVHQDRTCWPHLSGRHGRTASLADASPAVARASAIQSSGEGEIQFSLGDGCFFGTYPIGGGRTYGAGYLAEPLDHRSVEGRLATLRERYRAFGRPLQSSFSALERDDQIHCGAVEALELPEWRMGRV